MGTDGPDNEINPTREAFLRLLRSGLSGEGLTAEMIPELDAEQWDEVIRTAEKQTVSGIVFSAAAGLKAGGPPLRQAAVMAARLSRIAIEGQLMDRALTGLLSLLGKSGIVPVVQKGQGVARLYPTPRLRQAGDIDLYFKSAEERTSAESLLVSSGTPVRRMPDGSSLYTWHGVPVEHHSRLTDLRRIPSWAESFEHVVWVSDTDSVPGLMPSPECNLLLLCGHILKHTMGHGIGLRQFCDLAAAYHGYYGRTDYDKLKTMYSMCGLTRWHNLLGTVLTETLGLDRRYLDPLGFRPDANYKRMVEMTFEGGNFGLHKGKRGKSGTARAFFRNAPFAMRYAPREYISTIWRLFIGNIRK